MTVFSLLGDVIHQQAENDNLKRYFPAKDSSKKQTKTRRILVKTNSFARFLEESSAGQFAFEIN